MATPSVGIFPRTNDNLIDVMTTGYRWNNDGPIYYSFSDGLNGEFWLQPASVADHLQVIFSIIDYYINVDFHYTGYFSSPYAASAAGSDINISLDSIYISDVLGNNTWAVGLFPNVIFAQSYLEELYYSGAEGDIYININSAANSIGYEPGQAGFSLALHEIGHTLGLKHPHDDGGTDRPTFLELGIERFNVDWITVMSYDDDYNWNLNAWDPATPMILDVIALQFLYGANVSTNSGDEVYVLTSNNNFYQTIFDASGNDTIDLSNFGAGAYVEMPQYVLSDYQYAPFGLVTTIDGGEAIAGGGSPYTLNWILGEIETLVGSPFGDQILVGPGDDTIDGGSGTDQVYFFASFEDCQISFDGDVCIVESALDGRNSLTNVETLVFDYAGVEDRRDVSDLANVPQVPPMPDASDWQLLTTDGLFVGIGGNGQVYGTTAHQEVLVLDFEGSISFDASFNRGDDIVDLSGNAADWVASRSGSSAILFDGNTFVQIPFGPTGLALNFDDGVRTLRYDTGDGALKIGTFTVGTEYASIVAPAENVTLPTGYDPDAIGRLLLSGGADVIAGGDLEIFGTSGPETVTLLLGDVSLDPSFNRGGDVLGLVGNAADFEASVSGSFVLLENSDYHLEIPAGPNGLDIVFLDGVRTLLYDTQIKSFVIGSQEIGATPMPLTIA